MNRARILVEGGDDAHVIKHIAKSWLQRELNLGKEIINCQDRDRLIDRIETIQNDSDFDTAAIVIDADKNALATWAEIRKKAGSAFLPEAPTLDVLPWTKGRRISVWIMPSIGEAGDMETFLTSIRKGDDGQNELHQYALRTVAALPHRLFAEKDTHKAEFRTWLAWQKEPGASPGLALSLDAFDSQHPRALAFRTWLDTVLTHQT